MNTKPLKEENEEQSTGFEEIVNKTEKSNKAIEALIKRIDWLIEEKNRLIHKNKNSRNDKKTALD